MIFLLAFLACCRSIVEAGKILLPQGKFPRSYGQSNHTLQHFLLWAVRHNDVDHKTDVHGLAIITL